MKIKDPLIACTVLLIISTSATFAYTPNSVAAYLYKGVQEYNTNNYTAAKFNLLNAVKIDDTCNDAHKVLGVIFAKEKNYDRAIEHFNKAITGTLNPKKESELKQLLFKAYCGQAEEYFIYENYEQGQKSIEQALNINPDDGESNFLIGLLYLRNNDNSKAKDFLEKAQSLAYEHKALKEQLSIIYHNIGYSYFQNKQYELATLNFQKALEYNPENKMTKKALKYSIYRQGDKYWVKKANNLLTEKNYKFRNKESKKYLAKGLKDLKNEYYSFAARNFKKLAKSEPQLPLGNIMVAKTYIKMKMNGAEKYYKRALEIDPNIEEAKNFLSSYYLKQARKDFKLGQIEKTQKLVNLAIGVKPQNPAAYKLRGDIYLRSKNYNQAILEYEKALIYHPEYTPAQINLFYLKQNSTTLKSINQIKETAPEKLHNLVQHSFFSNQTNEKRLHRMIDILWSDKDGRTLLSLILDKEIKIKACSKYNDSHVFVRNYYPNQGNDIISFNGQKISSYPRQLNKTMAIYIDSKAIEDFFSSGSSPFNKMNAICVLVHELVHAADVISCYDIKSTMLEEITANIIGYNVASRILTGNDLTKEQVRQFVRISLIAILKDDHRYLDVYNDIFTSLKNVNIEPPYKEEYSDLGELYGEIRDNPYTKKSKKLEQLYQNSKKL